MKDVNNNASLLNQCRNINSIVFKIQFHFIEHLLSRSLCYSNLLVDYKAAFFTAIFLSLKCLDFFTIEYILCFLFFLSLIESNSFDAVVRSISQSIYIFFLIFPCVFQFNFCFRSFLPFLNISLP